MRRDRFVDFPLVLEVPSEQEVVRRGLVRRGGALRANGPGRGEHGEREDERAHVTDYKDAQRQSDANTIIVTAGPKGSDTERLTVA